MDNETKHERFVRIAVARTNKIIDMIHLLGNCSNHNQYEYSQKDVNKMFRAIQDELDDAKRRYTEEGNRKNKKFTLN